MSDIASDKNYFMKLPKLNGAEDYINWNRRVYACTRRQDIEFLCFTDGPENVSNAAKKKWLEAMIHAKASINLSLGSGPLAQFNANIDDDERTAKELWDAISTLYTSSNTQVIINLQSELDRPQFKDGGNWEKGVDKFNEIPGKIASYDAPVSREEKASKLIKCLPESFAPLAWFSEASNNITYDRLLVIVSGEFSRGRNIVKNASPTNPCVSFASRGNGSRGRFGSISKQRRRTDQNSYVCGKPGHFASECWHRQDRGTEIWQQRPRT